MKKLKRWHYGIIGLGVTLGVGAVLVSHLPQRNSLPNGSEKSIQSYAVNDLTDVETIDAVEDLTNIETTEEIARILKINNEQQTLVVERMSEYSILGSYCEVNCEEASVFIQKSDYSLVDYTFDSLKEGDVVLLTVGEILESYPTETSAHKIIWLGSKGNQNSEMPQYSVVYMPQSPKSIILENVEGEQREQLEQIIREALLSSVAIEGKSYVEMGECYLIRYNSKKEIVSYWLYKSEGEVYLQNTNLHSDVNDIAFATLVNKESYDKIASWFPN